MSVIASFAEESCWDKDQFRQVRKSVTFRIFSPGKIQGIRVDHAFEADFGVWYDPGDEYLIAKLTDLGLGINWGRLIYWKKLDHSEIEVFSHEDDERPVAFIRVRGRVGGDPSGEEDRSNVVELSQFRLAREAKMAGSPADRGVEGHRDGGED